MNRKDAISYLERKGEIERKVAKYSEADEKEIKEVQKKGKIYGDPVAMVQ